METVDKNNRAAALFKKIQVLVLNEWGGAQACLCCATWSKSNEATLGRILGEWGMDKPKLIRCFDWVAYKGNVPASRPPELPVLRPSGTLYFERCGYFGGELLEALQLYYAVIDP